MLKSVYGFFCRSWRTLESSLLVASLFSMILLTVLQIILRNFFSYNISWVEPLNQHLVLVIAFLGAMIAGRNGEHIAFDAVQHYLPNKLKKIVALLGSILSAAVCFYLAYISTKLTYLDFIDPMPAFGSTPQWIFEIIIPIGFFVIGIRLLKVAIFAITNAKKIEVQKP